MILGSRTHSKQTAFGCVGGNEPTSSYLQFNGCRVVLHGCNHVVHQIDQIALVSDFLVWSLCNELSIEVTGNVCSGTCELESLQ